MDVLTLEQRRRCMSAIKSKHTKPERLVRMLLRRMGYRYRMHVAELPGKPDIVLRGRRIAIFVHGCFWHSHRCRYGRVTPATHRQFWRNKRLANLRRDKQNYLVLRDRGWKVINIWECWTRYPYRLLQRLARLLAEV